MDEELLRAIIEGVGVGGTIISVVWLLRPVLLKWLENIAADREREAERLKDERESERELAQALNGVRTELNLSRGINNQLISKIDTLPTRDDIDQAGTSMRLWGERHDQKLNLVHDDVKTIPAEVVRLGTSNLETMRRELEQRLTTLQDQITARIDPDAENAQAIIRNEFAAMATRLGEIEALIKRFAPPQPGEGKETTPETNSEESQEKSGND